MTYGFRTAAGRLQRDIGHLRPRDRAVLRILNRAGAATAAHLTVLAYRNRRVAQERLRQLWRWGFLERAPVPTAAHGGPALAYRLSGACLQRLGYRRDPWRGPGYLAHTLDGVEAVCSLVGFGDPELRPLVQLWLPESIAGDVLPDGILPDALVVLATAAGSGVVCLEIDEATQHIAPILDKLRAYRRALEGRVGWHVLFVVPTMARQTWLRRVAAQLDLGGTGFWVVIGDELRPAGIDAPIARLGGHPHSTRLRDALVDPRDRRSATPVATRAWLELLGSGGGEGLEGVLV